MTTQTIDNQGTTIFRTERIGELLAGLDALTLENRAAGRRISIYLPAGRLPEDATKSQIQLKNLVAELGQRFDQGQFADPTMRDVLERLENVSQGGDFTENEDFWQNQLGGLAIFADGESIRPFKVAWEFEPAAFFSTHWHLTPLLALAANVDCYWLLALSQNEVRFFRGSRLGIREVELPDTPTSFRDSKTAAARSNGDDPAILDADADKENLSHFFREIDKGVTAATAESTAPLILAGVDYYFPLFKAVCSYGHLAQEGISGNVEHTDPSELHPIACEALKHEFLQSRKRELLRIRDLSGSGLAENRLPEVLRAAHEGRVHALVAPSDSIFWGRFDNESGNAAVKLPSADPRGRDLFQQAAEVTLSHGGQVYYLESAKMPEGKSICAELRY